MKMREIGDFANTDFFLRALLRKRSSFFRCESATLARLVSVLYDLPEGRQKCVLDANVDFEEDLTGVQNL